MLPAAAPAFQSYLRSGDSVRTADVDAVTVSMARLAPRPLDMYSASYAILAGGREQHVEQAPPSVPPSGAEHLHSTSPDNAALTLRARTARLRLT